MNEHAKAATPIKPLAPKKPVETEAKAPKAPKAPKEPKESNFKKVYPDSAVITLLSDKNPKRAGSKSFDRFAHYKSGMTVSQAIAAGVQYADLSWDVGHGFISVSK